MSFFNSSYFGFNPTTIVPCMDQTPDVASSTQLVVVQVKLKVCVALTQATVATAYNYTGWAQTEASTATSTRHVQYYS